jgi:hypothetical protein
MTRSIRTTRHSRPGTRWPRRLGAIAFVLALVTVGFAATVASLAVPSPATPTVTTIAYVPVPAGPPVTSSGGGR